MLSYLLSSEQMLLAETTPVGPLSSRWRDVERGKSETGSADSPDFVGPSRQAHSWEANLLRRRFVLFLGSAFAAFGAPSSTARSTSGFFDSALSSDTTPAMPASEVDERQPLVRLTSLASLSVRGDARDEDVAEALPDSSSQLTLLVVLLLLSSSQKRREGKPSPRSGRSASVSGHRELHSSPSLPDCNTANSEPQDLRHHPAVAGSSAPPLHLHSSPTSSSTSPPLSQLDILRPGSGRATSSAPQLGRLSTAACPTSVGVFSSFGV